MDFCKVLKLYFPNYSLESQKIIVSLKELNSNTSYMILFWIKLSYLCTCKMCILCYDSPYMWNSLFMLFLINIRIQSFFKLSRYTLPDKNFTFAIRKTACRRPGTVLTIASRTEVHRLRSGERGWPGLAG